MKKSFCLLFLIGILNFSVSAQTSASKIITDSLYSADLENEFGENPTRAISIYLPPGYEENTQKYPVIYFLHGFMGDNTVLGYMREILDFAIKANKIRPFIMVIPDEKTTYDSSFYSNTIFGNWEDFTAFDLVDYVDSNFRTIPHKNSRGITGHSMGGYGALKIAMHHPDIFSSVYALSSGALTIASEYGPNSETYKQLAEIETEEELMQSYFPKVIVAFAKSWSPNPDNPPFYCDLPFEVVNGKLVTHKDILKKWYNNMPVHMIDENLENLQQLNAIKMDWGRNAGDGFTIQSEMFSQRLENSGITHFAEEYIGTHVSGIYTKDGRIPNAMLPFFDFYLEFEE